MVDFICQKCKKTFNNKYNLKRHQENSLSCGYGRSKNNKISYYSCKKCSRNFTRKDSLKKHQNLGRCTKTKKFVVKGNNNSNINKIKSMSNVDKIKSKSNINKNNTISDINKIKVNGDNNNVVQANLIKTPITINLVYFGKDGIKNLTYDEINNLLKSNENPIEFLIKTVNLNPLKPHHHNILYTNLRSAYGKAYKNDKWVQNKISELIDVLIDAKLEDLNDILNEMVFLSKKTKQKIRNTIVSLDQSKPNARKKLASYIKPILYEHRKMIEKTMKLTREQEEKIIKNEQKKAEKDAKKEERQWKKNKS